MADESGKERAGIVNPEQLTAQRWGGAVMDAISNLPELRDLDGKVFDPSTDSVSVSYGGGIQIWRSPRGEESAARITVRSINPSGVSTLSFAEVVEGEDPGLRIVGSPKNKERSGLGRFNPFAKSVSGAERDISGAEFAEDVRLSLQEAARQAGNKPLVLYEGDKPKLLEEDETNPRKLLAAARGTLERKADFHRTNQAPVSQTPVPRGSKK